MVEAWIHQSSQLAALAGAAIGELTSVLASWLTQRTQAHAQWIAQEKLRRQDLYKDFIEDASKSHVHALQHNNADIPNLVGLYSRIGRMRVLSAPEVITCAEQIAHKILDTYLEPDKTRRAAEMAHDGSIACSASSPRPAVQNMSRFAPN